jgi:antitoxin component of RelBE/YafQ-DinJ toxin-antitoxin module
MNTAILNIKTDPETKEQLKAFASNLGLPVSALLNAQIRQMLRTRKVEFEVSLEPTPYLKKIIKEVESDNQIGRNFVQTTNRTELVKLLKTL